MERHITRSTLLVLGALLAATPAGAQETDLPPVAAVFTMQGIYARPVGEFHEHVKQGGGMNLSGAWQIPSARALALRGDGGFVVYGSETVPVCFSSTVGCRVRLDLTTTNSIAYINAGPQLMLPEGPVRPYVNAAVGLSWFGTSSSVRGDDSGESFASTTNHSDYTFSWASGGGIMIPVAAGKTPVQLDIGARYHGNGRVEYLKKGDIKDNPDNSISYTPTRSEANLVSFQLGVTIGARPGMH